MRSGVSAPGARSPPPPATSVSMCSWPTWPPRPRSAGLPNRSATAPTDSTSSSTTPGWSCTGGPLLYRVLTPLARPFMKGPGQGADTVVWLASSPEVEGVNGRYFTRRRAIRSSKRSYDQDAARRLWEVSERLTGLLDQEKGERQ